jgi:hypothetical protein
MLGKVDFGKSQICESQNFAKGLLLQGDSKK